MAEIPVLTPNMRTTKQNKNGSKKKTEQEFEITKWRCMKSDLTRASVREDARKK